MTLPGERIRARRKEFKYTQRALAKLVRVSHVTISQWETGDSEPGGKNLFALAKALQCSPTWIMYGDEDSSPIPPNDQPRQLSEREEELLSLFSSLPESEKERQMSILRVKAEEFNRLFEELLKARRNK